MKKRFFAVYLVLSTGLLAAPMSVQVRNCKVRATPSQLGSVVATLEYGAVVEAAALQNGWYPVKAGGQDGWLHSSALSKKAVALKSGATDAATGASADEVALAGKGFNEQVEKKLKDDGTLDFTWVDRMAGFLVGEDRIAAFRKEGGLPGGEQ